VCTCRHPIGYRCDKEIWSVTIESEGQNSDEVNLCPPLLPFAHIGKATNWQIFPDSTTCKKPGCATSLGQSRDPRGARERVRKAIDNSSNSSKVTEQGSARGYSTIKHGQINFKRVSSPFHQPTITINPSSSANTTTT